MSERITKTNLERRIESLNRRMDDRDSIYRYQVEGRNGYTALDRFKRDENASIHLPDSVPGRGLGWILVSTVRVGTKSEIGEFLHAMMVALDDADYKVSELVSV